MKDPQQQPTVPARAFWVRLFHRLRQGLGFLYGTLLLGILVNLMSNQLSFTSVFDWIGHHMLISAVIGGGLLLLTILAWWGGYQVSGHTRDHAPPIPTPQSRNAVMRLLHQEYTRRFTQSLQGAALLPLRLHERTDVTQSSAQLVFRRTQVPAEHPFPPGTTITQVYDDAGKGLLILGKPGTGKTTLLLDLARELLTRAQVDPICPLPVILNLSSWATKKTSLADWLIGQMQLVYGIPARLGHAWVQADHLLILLDGLDEVAASTRSACIEAINTYREEHLASLVVCSRSDGYLTQQARLAFPSAVVVQPLTQEQVTMYLKQHYSRTF